ncbi:hypothetical protein D6C84_04702 [Aureobasidium pullulans]|uniref:FAD-binding domain-containing protein n=1 Tax=Aureobasidium pullulans TaxID=5580 RepID=A0A4S9XYW1_AURPU|nr:hypothetical protein D6C84_04702 [Aureobasidium pullulans]
MVRSTGLALAHGLKKAGIPFVIFEKEESPTRPRNWSMGCHWAIPSLEYLLPEKIFKQIENAQVDPHIPTSDNDRLPLHNGETGELIIEIKSSKFYRLRRDKFRGMMLQGIDVQWGKALVDIEYSDDRNTVTAKFADGTQDSGALLVATDGPHSMVRGLLVGEKKARATAIDYASTMCFTRYSREQAQFLRAKPHHPLYQVAPHPAGYCAWLSLHDGDDLEHPENWIFFHYISFPEPRDEVNTRSMREHVAHQKGLAKLFADPWRSAFDWMPDYSEVWYSKLRNWDPTLPGHRWNNRDGRVSLAGDAAHPMTFQRGQGLNHALRDAFTMCKAIESFWNGGNWTPEQRSKVIKEYEEEMIPRTGEEVRLSEKNSVAMHNWKVKESPSMKKGMNVDKKDA